jgi:hypothetical protein
LPIKTHNKSLSDGDKACIFSDLMLERKLERPFAEHYEVFSGFGLESARRNNKHFRR